MLYIIKTFGRTHYFKTPEDRQKYIDTLPEWELKAAEVYDQLIGGK